MTTGVLQFEQRKVLVLNRDWMPLQIWPLQRALIKLFSTYADGTPKAKIIDPNRDFAEFTWSDWTNLKVSAGDEYLGILNRGVPIPKVVKVRYDKPPHEQVTFSRRRLYKRDRYTCQYCGARPGSEELTVDHIMPRSKGGLSTWQNCCLSCLNCNLKKANRTPKEAKMSFFNKKFIPKKPKWSLIKDDGRFYRKHYKEWEHFISDMYWDVDIGDE